MESQKVNMSKKTSADIKKLSKQIITEVSKLDIDEPYRIEVFGALLTRRLPSQEPQAEMQHKEKSKKPLSLSERILALRDKGFFKQSKSDLEVHSEILKNYACNRTRVSVELLRLSKRDKLRRTEKLENGRKVVAYAW